MKDASDEVTAAHAATLTGLSERTIRRKIAAGEIPARHIARNRYAIHVRDLPVRQSPHDLFTRVEAMESRVRLLELQYAYLAARQAVSEGAPPVSNTAEAQAELGTSDMSQGTAVEGAAAAAEIHELLAQLARETQRLTPLMTALMTGQPSAPSVPPSESRRSAERMDAEGESRHGRGRRAAGQ